MAVVKVENDSIHDRFLVRLPEGEGELIYRQHPSHVLELVHTEVDPGLRGRGVAEALAETAIAYARAQGMRIIPSCPYVKRWLAKHPEHQDLVGSG